MRLTAHISDELRRRLDDYIQNEFNGRHGMISYVVERALIEYLNKIDKK